MPHTDAAVGLTFWKMKFLASGLYSVLTQSRLDSTRDRVRQGDVWGRPPRQERADADVIGTNPERERPVGDLGKVCRELVLEHGRERARRKLV